MPRWPDLATQSASPNTSGSITDHMYVVVHTADGSYNGTVAWQLNRESGISSHFVVGKDGRITQMLDTNQKGWTQKAGNSFSISIENEGNENTPLTAYQIEANARILARVHQVHGVPLQLTGHVGTRGLGHHSMGAESNVDWGHSLCPGSIIKGQKQAILDRAKQIVNGVVSVAATTEEVDDMPTFTINPGGGQDNATSLCIPLAKGRRFVLCNETFGKAYALRLWMSNGQAWSAMPATTTDGFVQLTGGQRWAVDIADDICTISIVRMGRDTSKPAGQEVVPASTDFPPFPGHLTCAIERS
jgi:hypothetical protein